MSVLTTHILDTTHGVPAAGVRIELFKYSGGVRTKLREATTNADGRTDAPLLSADQCVANIYELLFHVGDYFRRPEGGAIEFPFFDHVPVRFTVHDLDRNYHVPLLISPWGYTTYRGS